MRLFSSILLVSAVVSAQSPLTTTFANNNGGSSGGAIYFELEALDPAGVTIFEIDLNVGGAGGTSASFGLYLQPLGAAGTLAPLGDWIGPLATGTAATTAPAGMPTTFTLDTPIGLALGSRFGVAIAGDFAHAYTNGGGGVPLVYTTTELELLACCATNVPFTGTVFQPRVVNTNIYYASGGGGGTIARCTPRGDGCVDTFASFHETLTPAAFDLNGMKLTATANGSGYDITLAPGAGFGVPAGAIQLPLSDDSSVDTDTVGGTLGLWAGSNCWLATGSGNSNSFVPSVGTLLANPSTGVYSWTDLNPSPAASGKVWYDEPSATVGRLTYDGVYAFGSTDPNYVQITYDTATGDFSIEWGATGAANFQDWLVGFSPGGPNDDPGPTDISMAAPFSIAAADGPALALACVGRPVQGRNATPFFVQTTNIDPDAFFHLGVVGFAEPGISLGMLGFPASCTLYVNPSVPRMHVFAPPSSTAPAEYTWRAVVVPPAAAGVFTGFEFSVQTLTLVFGFDGPSSRASNALDCVIGTL